MTSRDNVSVMLEIFAAIERRDPRPGLLDVEFNWPPSLPYGGTSRGPRVDGSSWSETWDRLQPTQAERRLEPRVVAASEEEVVILWRQRGINGSGDRLDTPVLGLYRVRDGKLTRAQMFYFDTAAVLAFLAKATT